MIPLINILRVYFLSFIIFFVAELYSSTTVIATCKNNRLFIGADSKIINKISGDTVGCKIILKNNMCFSFAGFIGSDYPIVLKYAHAASYGEASIVEKIKYFEDIIKTSFPAHVVKGIKDTTHTTENWLGFEAIIVGVEKNSVYFTVRRFTPHFGKKETKIVVYRFPLYNTKDANGWFYVMGNHENIDKMLSSKSKGLSNNPVELINFLINIEISKNPDIVSPPIVIIETSRDGFRWIQNGKNCYKFY